MTAKPSATEIQAIFNRIAPVYDHLNQWLSLGQHKVWKLMAVKWCAPQPGDRALDLCCGSGDLAQLLAQQVGVTGQTIGVDFSRQQLAIAQQRAQQRLPHLNMTWVEADVLHLPFAADSFDCATMGYGLRNVADIPTALKDLHRVLKSGAKAAILDFHRPSSAALQAFQQWYLQTMVVPMAEQFDLTEEYAYIMPSLARFPCGDEQVALAQATGFTKATHYAIAGGMMGVLVVTKSRVS